MKHNTGDRNSSANHGGRDDERTSKILLAIAAALLIAVIAFVSGYMGMKLAAETVADQVADQIEKQAAAPDTDTAANLAGTPQGDLPVYTAMGDAQEQPTPAPSPTPAATPEPEKTRFPESEVVAFEDPEVEKTIRAALGRPEGDITAGDMMAITTFNYDPVNDKSATGTITTLADLRYCVNLNTLHVLHQPVTSIECLRELDQIQDVCILGCAVSDISPLAGKERLTDVWISGNPVSDASCVLALPNLREFNASFGTYVTDISAIPATSSLENFFCDNVLNDYTPLLKLKNLRAVMLVGISDGFFREMVQNFRNMSSIRISNSDIEEESLHLLEGYSLYALSLKNCGLKDISALADLGGVSDLRLGGNQIEDISALKAFSQISYCLDLRNNEIEDLSPLENMRLSTLVVSGNPYTDASITVLDKLENDGCQIIR
mgnify:CR=1 FL=1